MSFFSYHRVKFSFFEALKRMMFPVKTNQVNGLLYSITMSTMELGSPIFALSRLFSRELIWLAQWDNKKAFDDFMETHDFGKTLNNGWYVQLSFLRQWGTYSGINSSVLIPDVLDDNHPVVAITIARMKYFQIPRFLRWGKPAEELVKQHKGTTMSLASIRYPNTISTCSIWINEKEMTDMVFGHSNVLKPKRHIDAMKERTRKDFYTEFSALRFKVISEHGTWNGKSNYVPCNIY